MEEVVEDSSGEVEPSRHPKRGKGILSKARGRREGEGIKVRGGRREWKAVGGWICLNVQVV